MIMLGGVHAAWYDHPVCIVFFVVEIQFCINIYFDSLNKGYVSRNIVWIVQKLHDRNQLIFSLKSSAARWCYHSDLLLFCVLSVSQNLYLNGQEINLND